MGTCNPLTPDAYKYIVRVPLVSPFAFQWIKANNPRDDIADSVDFVKAPTTGAQGATGASIHSGTNRLSGNPEFGKWHHVSIDVAGEIMYPATEPEKEAPEVQSFGNRSTLLKARITLAMGTARERCFDFDIGAGVEFDVTCQAVNKLEVLIPDPRVDIPDEPVAVPPLAPQQLATVLTSTIYFMPQRPQGYPQPLLYTVPLVLVTGTPIFVPRQPDSIEITGGTDGVTTATVIDFLYVPDGLRQVQYSAPPSFFVLDQVIIPPGTTRFPRVSIPGHANAFRVVPAGAPGVGSLIQVLNV